MYKRYQFSASLLLLCILTSNAWAQNLADSIFKLNENAAKVPSKGTVTSADTTFNALIKRVDFYADKFNDISNQLNDGFDTLNISEDLPRIEERLRAFQKNSFDDGAVTLRYLSTFEDYFATTQKQLDKWDKQLSEYNTSLTNIQEILCGLTTDSVFKNLPADSSLRDRFFGRINALGPKWHRLDSISNRAILKIGVLESRISESQLQVLDYNEKIKTGLKVLSDKTFTKEYDYLWDVNLKGFFVNLKEGLVATLSLNYKIFNYYIKYGYKVHIINFLLFILVFFWLLSNRNTIQRENKSSLTIFENALLTSKFPIVGALTVTCTIGPFFYYHPPVVLNTIYLVVLLFCIGILIKRIFDSNLANCWFILLGFVALYSICNLYIYVFPSERIIFFLLTLVVLLFSLRNYEKHKFKIPEKHKNNINYLSYIYFSLLIISLICNLFGRYSLSKIAATTAVFTLVEGISLLIFVKIITEGIYLQMEVGKIHINRFSSYLDFKNLKNRIGNFLRFLAIVLLFVYFTQNLGIFDDIYDETKKFLLEVRKIGSTTFTFAGFIIFILIIYLSTVVAKIISYFFEFADEHAAKSNRRKNYSSSILLVRLFIWTIGFLIAIAASGIPIDKITIILGALGVGIGFGLQNLVNNVVSGLVMVFEKPVQVGDLIEVGDKTGTVRSMGIRASKILTLEGSEVIIPNGDLLSQNLINWTLSNTHKRICLQVGVAYGTDVDKVKQIFKSIIEESEDVMQTPAPLILLDAFGDNSVNFKILCWVADIDNWLMIQSVLMSRIFEEFYKQGIQIPFPQRDVHVYMKEGKGNSSSIPEKRIPRSSKPDEDK